MDNFYKVGQIVRYIGPNNPWPDGTLLKIAKRDMSSWSGPRYMVVPELAPIIGAHQWTKHDHIRPLSPLEQLGMSGE